MATSAFAKAFEKKAQKVFSEAKKHKHREGNSFGPVDIPDGSYSAIVTLDTSVPTKGSMEGVPIVRAKGQVTTGPYEGKEPSQSYFCEGKPPVPEGSDEMPTAEQQLLALLAWLLPDIQIDDISQVSDAIDLVNERRPLAIIGIRNTKSKNTGKDYQNLYFNKLVKPVTAEGEIKAQASTTTETSEAPTEDTTYVPAKGDMVFIDGDESGTEYEVVQVSQSKQTANVVDSEGSKTNGVAWHNLQPA